MSANLWKITGYPSILGGRVKGAASQDFGGILYRRDGWDRKDYQSYDIPSIDLVIVDLYPFEKQLRNATEKKSSKN